MGNNHFGCTNMEFDRYNEDLTTNIKEEQHLDDSVVTAKTANNFPFSYESGLNKFSSATECSSTKVMTISVLASATLEAGQELTITGRGLVDSKRNTEDGYVYFGCKRKIIKGGPIINDFVIKSIDEEMAERHRGIHFYIKHDREKDCFKINDQGIGLGVFRQIYHQTTLRDSQLINFGLTFVVINTAYGQYDDLLYNPEMQNLQNQTGLLYFIDSPEGFRLVDHQEFVEQIKFSKWAFLKLSFYGNSTNEESYLFCTNTSQGVITIGRDLALNLIGFSEDKLMSKFQCQIFYDNTKGWTLQDQDSTNGIWIYVGEEFTLFEGMKFKANHTTFQVLQITS